MPDAPTQVVIDIDRFDAVIVDLDGVLTDTARIHRQAWAELFTDYFARAASVSGRQVAPFDDAVDYPRHLDGRLRHEGAGAVLASRGIVLPPGLPTDGPGDTSVWALANRKQEIVDRHLTGSRVAVLPGAFEFIRALRRAGIRSGLVSASRNADAVLASAGLGDRFDVRVDGVDAERLNLPGKPDPASFHEAAARLKVPPQRIAVFEDAPAGVGAARAGGFGFVVGVAAGGHAEVLRENGAHACIPDLTAVTVEERFACCRVEHPGDAEWVLTLEGRDAVEESRREALCSLGNGAVGTRGAAPEAAADGVHYPGTYCAGVYNRVVSRVNGITGEHEDLVNIPNWLSFTFRTDPHGEWFGSPRWEVLDQRWELDIRHAMVMRYLRLRDPDGRRLTVEQRRLISMRDRHIAALETRLTPDGWSGRLELRSGLDADVANTGVQEYRWFPESHLEHVHVAEVDRETIALSVETSQSRIRIAEAARLRVRTGDSATRTVEERPVTIADIVSVPVHDGETVVAEKVVAIVTSRDRAVSDCRDAAVDEALTADDVDEIAARHRAEWERLWASCAIWMDTSGRTPAIVNLHVLHLVQALSPRHSTELDIGAPPRGLSGEAYRGHVFWDELFIIPFFNLRFPELSRSLLMYRYRRLDAARRLAREAGHRGAMFPWQSGSDGREETPTMLYNERSERWMTDYSHLQRHVGLSIAYIVWDYFQVTGDLAFLRGYGVDLLVEIARFWASVAVYHPERDRYDIGGVMGPDEFHDGGPDSPGAGVTNNTYTNVMAAWVLTRACEAVDRIAGAHGGEVWDRLDLRHEELDQWERLSRRLTVEFDGAGRLTQFRAYEELAELDWDRYRTTYRNIGRLDLILNAEGDSPNRYKVAKQADVLMLFYLFSAEELTAVLDRLGYSFDPATIPATVRYFLARTSHGSTLSRVVHAWVLARTDREHSWRLFLEALASDVDDTQGGTTGEGLHLGAMGGTVDLLQRCYSGLDIREDAIHLNPRLPDELPRLRFEIAYRGHRLELDITHEVLSVRSRPATAPPIDLHVVDAAFTLHPGTMVRHELTAR
jgi:HAD superfamily hydrolase (TIGR01509 family)